MPRPNAAARLQGLGGGDVFYAVRSYVRGAVQLCDIVSPDANQVWFGCVVLNSQANRISAPSEVWSGDIDPELHPLVIALYRSLGRSPIVIAKLDNPDVKYTKGAAPSGTQNRSVTKTTLDDVAIVNDDSRIVLLSKGNGGDIVIEPDRNLSVQLSSGVTRISRTGDASDGPYLAEPAKRRDDEIKALLDKIVALLGKFTVQPVTLSGSPNPLAFCVQYTAAGPAAPGAYVHEVSTLAPLDTLDLADIKSAVLRLSSETSS